MVDDVKDTILAALEAALEAQLRAVQRLRRGELKEEQSRPRKGRSQVDMAYDVLKEAGTPLHISEILERIHAAFHVTVDRESLVSSLTKKVLRGDRFVRAAKGTFGLR
ncbi:MAG: winged helix-turn-helix domain-containing protein [Acidobacteria bacterium]|nr:winged helix-turn-helix domain-containing protein [Acidobacteriota bacterium]